MADLPDHIRLTLDEFKTRVTTRIAELRQSLSLLNAIESSYGLPFTSLDDVLGEQPSPNSNYEIGAKLVGVADLGLPAVTFKPLYGDQGARSAQRHQPIRPDQFLGQPPLEAAKRYLADIGHALEIDVIGDAIKRGGAAIVGTDWKEKLEESLTRSVADVIKVQDHTFGLTRFYTEDQIKGVRATRRQSPTGKTGKKRGRPKKTQTSQKSAAQTRPTETKPKPTPQATLEQIERIKALKQEGKKLGEIAREVGLHHLNVYRILGGKSGKKAKSAEAA